MVGVGREGDGGEGMGGGVGFSEGFGLKGLSDVQTRGENGRNRQRG